MSLGTFYLGTHKASWLTRAGVPLFISHRTLAARKSLPRATAPWALDSGGFTELSMHGRWVTGPDEYAHAVARYMEEVGQLAWAAPQDWMCEAEMLARTGLSVAEHQHRTVTNLCELRETYPTLPIIPVLQGWSLEEYLHCLELYRQAGYDLTAERLVGLGTICRRHDTAEATHIIRQLHQLGLRLHAFGLKSDGWHKTCGYLGSADSMAWSIDARYTHPLPGHPHSSCANCLEYAMRWRARHLRTGWQPSLEAAAR